MIGRSFAGLAVAGLTIALSATGGTRPVLAQPAGPVPVAPGRWGAQGVLMVVSDKGAALDFACAHASIPGRLTTNREGRIDVTGVYAAEHAGPAREGEPERTRPARFTGRLDGHKLTLTILLGRPAERLGPYTLERGKTPRLVKCQ